jgi:putative thiamine transport system permease protein
VGFAVSVAQYLPTLFAGAGRFATLTTEAVALAGGADRRVLGVYAFLQALLPLMAFAAVLALRPRRARICHVPVGAPL